MRSVADYNAKNREAPTAAASLARGTGNFARSKTRPRDRPDGKAKCANKGCGRIYDPETENGPDACRYHSGLPVFGGMEKFWRCCPENGKHWERGAASCGRDDFRELLGGKTKIPTRAIGSRSSGR